MKQELDDLLCDRYPGIFRERHAAMGETCMNWGFSCNDGWFALIDVLCREIERHGQSRGLDVVAVQVKEKLGGLRFYVRGADAYVNGLIWMASALSEHICEECGAPGRLSNDGWLRTSCTEHGGGAQSHEEPWRSVRIVFGADASNVAPDGARPHRFTIPPLASHGWRHLAQALEEVMDNDIARNGLPPVVLEEVIESEVLAFRWHGGDELGRTAAFFRMVEALSVRIDPVSGRPHQT